MLNSGCLKIIDTARRTDGASSVLSFEWLAMQVLILFGFLAAMGGLFLLVAVLVWWVMRQIAHAQKYRQLKALVAEAESAMGIAPEGGPSKGVLQVKRSPHQRGEGRGASKA